METNNKFLKTTAENNFGYRYVLFIIVLATNVVSSEYVAATKSFEIPIYRQHLVIGSSENLAAGGGGAGSDNLLNENNDEMLINKTRWYNDTIRLSKFMDGEYYGVIRIGNPARDFKISFDTTWADTWVPSVHCGLWEIACMIHTKYDGSRSSTYQEDGRIFDTGDTSNDLHGFISTDNFNLAHLTVKNHSFAEITHMPWIPYGLTRADGIIGLGFPNLRILPTPTFFNNMFKQGLIKKPVFTFYFNRDKTTERAGRLILGETDRKYVNASSLTAVPVIEKLYWKVKMDSVILNETGHHKLHYFCNKSCEAILDTSTNTITGPTHEINRINDLLGARSFVPPIFKLNRFMVSCRDAPKLSPIKFFLGGKPFEIQSKYYIQHFVYESMEVCLSPFVPNDQTFWQLGGAFLMEFYTEYDYNAGQVVIGKTIF